MSKAEPTLEEINSPTREIDYLEESNNVIDIISDILEEIVKENEESNQDSDDDTPAMCVFSSKKPPKITINKYFKRIMKYSKPEPSTLIISLIYIDKLCENTNFVLNSHNIHRIILASLMLAIKYNEDDYY